MPFMSRLWKRQAPCALLSAGTPLSRARGGVPRSMATECALAPLHACAQQLRSADKSLIGRVI
eukprot:1133151-Pelagomonas_calceolata.AAC.2